MWFGNHYLVKIIIEDRVKDALRRAEQARLIREAMGPRESRRWRWPVTIILKSLPSIFTGRRVAEPRRGSLETAPNPTRKTCLDSGPGFAVANMDSVVGSESSTC